MCGVYYQTLYVELADIVMETEKKIISSVCSGLCSCLMNKQNKYTTLSEQFQYSLEKS